MTMHQYLRSLPKTHWCEKCGAMVTKWHEHHGPDKSHKPRKPDGDG